jgi:hypothetical protein
MRGITGSRTPDDRLADDAAIGDSAIPIGDRQTRRFSDRRSGRMNSRLGKRNVRLRGHASAGQGAPIRSGANRGKVLRSRADVVVRQSAVRRSLSSTLSI